MSFANESELLPVSLSHLRISAIEVEPPLLALNVSCSHELCGVRVIPAVDVAVVQVKAARRC
jgi:hypothetical protein